MEVERAISPEHLHELTMWMRFPDKVSVRHGATLEEALVARQQNPSFAIGKVRKRRIVRVMTIGGIETGETQAPRQFAQVNVGDEANSIEGAGSNTCERCDIEGRESRKHRDSVAILYDVLEWHGHVVDENQVNLRMWHTESFDQILHRRVAIDLMRPGNLSTVGRQKVVERAVHSNPYLGHVEDPCPSETHPGTFGFCSHEDDVPPVFMRVGPVWKAVLL